MPQNEEIRNRNRRFRALYAAKLSDSMIAIECGCAVSTVSYWRNQNGLRALYKPIGGDPQPRKYDHAKIVALRQSGLTFAEIAKRLNMPSRGRAVQIYRMHTSAERAAS